MAMGSRGRPGGIIAGGAVALVLLVIGAVMIWVLIQRRKTDETTDPAPLDTELSWESDTDFYGTVEDDDGHEFWNALDPSGEPESIGQCEFGQLEESVFTM
jgi:hypothetical protein